MLPRLGDDRVRVLAMRVVPATFPVPIFDLERPREMRLVAGRLQLRLTTIEQQTHTVVFDGVLGVRWEADVPEALCGLRDDMPYEVLESPWLASLQRAVPLQQSSEPARHWVLPCNEDGSWLEIVAVGSPTVAPAATTHE